MVHKVNCNFQKHKVQENVFNSVLEEGSQMHITLFFFSFHLIFSTRWVQHLPLTEPAFTSYRGRWVQHLPLTEVNAAPIPYGNQFLQLYSRTCTAFTMYE